MNASVREQARHEGVSPSLIHRWRKRGMPADLEAGSEWRKRNAARSGQRPVSAQKPPLQATEPPPRVEAAPAPEPPEDTATEKEVLAIADQPEEIANGTEECRAALKSVRLARRFCESKMASCHKSGDDAMARQWVQTLQAVLSRQSALEDRFRDILERDKATISVSAAERTYRGVFQDIRQKLLAAPAALAARLNPQDPPHALGILEEYLQKTVFREIYETGN